MINKVFISDNKDIGVECRSWALNNLPDGFNIVDNKEDCNIFLSVQYDKILSEDLQPSVAFPIAKYADQTPLHLAAVAGEKIE